MLRSIKRKMDIGGVALKKAERNKRYRQKTKGRDTEHRRMYRKTSRGYLIDYISQIKRRNRKQKEFWTLKKQQLDKELEWLMNSEEQL